MTIREAQPERQIRAQRHLVNVDFHVHRLPVHELFHERQTPVHMITSPADPLG